MKSIRTSSCVSVTCAGEATTKPAAAIRSSIVASLCGSFTDPWEKTITGNGLADVVSMAASSRASFDCNDHAIGSHWAPSALPCRADL